MEEWKVKHWGPLLSSEADREIMVYQDSYQVPTDSSRSGNTRGGVITQCSFPSPPSPPPLTGRQPVSGLAIVSPACLKQSPLLQSASNTWFTLTVSLQIHCELLKGKNYFFTYLFIPSTSDSACEHGSDE